MVDVKIRTLLTLSEMGSYTKTAEALSLTQPAVSHHIKLLEEEFGIHIFVKGKHTLKPTAAGEILINYARRAMALSNGVRQAIEDCQRQIHSLRLGITPTASDIVVPQVLAAYCSDHSEISIQILRDSIKNIDSMLAFYELDFAIVDGMIRRDGFSSMLLGTDYLGLVVSPRHPFARRMSVRLDEIQQENMVMRPKGAETRRMFESYVISNGYLPRDFHVSMELDSVSNIKEIVMADLGISVLSHNVCLDELKRGQLVIVPIENCQMVRSINLIYPDDFSAPAVLQDIRRNYEEHFN